MIQKTTQRQLNAALGHPTDGLGEWGQWVRNRHYSLEVAQHPIRARMCGFGDKDRRPLAPAAVAKLIVRCQDDTILEPDDIDLDFFVVTVDLWSADGTREMNLVLHPSSTDRYVPVHVLKAHRKTTSGTEHTPTHSSRLGPYPRPPTNHHPPPPTPRTLESTQSIPIAQSTSFPFPAQPDLFPVPDTSTWTYPPAIPAPTLPSIHTLNPPPPSPSALPDITFAFPDLSPFRPWNAPDSQNQPLFDASTTDRWPTDSFIIPPDPWSPAAAPAPAPAPPSEPAPTQPFHPLPAPTTVPPSPTPTRPPPQSSSTPPPRHTYTRTLVGPLCANAQRLQDEHRKPGIFFLFQDLSIRTEGTFRLRMRLLNVGAPPAPTGPASAVHTSVSPVLAQVFTEPFTVYSAKRFPGVPDTTALSIAFGNQGQKLPLRNRFGPSKKRRRPHPLGAESSDDEYTWT